MGMLWKDLSVGEDIGLIKKAYNALENGCSITSTLKELVWAISIKEIR